MKVCDGARCSRAAVGRDTAAVVTGVRVGPLPVRAAHSALFGCLSECFHARQGLCAPCVLCRTRLWLC